jgi:hypothetical protein
MNIFLIVFFPGHSWLLQSILNFESSNKKYLLCLEAGSAGTQLSEIPAAIGFGLGKLFVKKIFKRTSMFLVIQSKH